MKTIYRFKTEKEFVEQYGSNWRVVVGWTTSNYMDYLFGNSISKESFNKVNKLKTSKIKINEYSVDIPEGNDWSIFKEMVTSIERPITIITKPQTMNKKQLATLTAKETGYSESYIYKVLCGTLSNKEIETVAARVKEGKTAYPAIKEGKYQKKVTTLPTHNIFRRVREVKGYTQEQLALKLNLMPVDIDEIERGIGIYNVSTYCQWLEVCDVMLSIKL